MDLWCLDDLVKAAAEEALDDSSSVGEASLGKESYQHQHGPETSLSNQKERKCHSM